MRNGIKYTIVENIGILKNHGFPTFGDFYIHESLREVGMRQWTVFTPTYFNFKNIFR